MMYCIELFSLSLFFIRFSFLFTLLLLCVIDCTASTGCQGLPSFFLDKQNPRQLNLTADFELVSRTQWRTQTQ